MLSWFSSPLQGTCFFVLRAPRLDLSGCSTSTTSPALLRFLFAPRCRPALASVAPLLSSGCASCVALACRLARLASRLTSKEACLLPRSPLHAQRPSPCGSVRLPFAAIFASLLSLSCALYCFGSLGASRYDRLFRARGSLLFPLTRSEL